MMRPIIKLIAFALLALLAIASAGATLIALFVVTSVIFHQYGRIGTLVEGLALIALLFTLLYFDRPPALDSDTKNGPPAGAPIREDQPTPY